MKELILTALKYAAETGAMGEIVETVAEWFAGRGEVDAMHAALDVASMRRAKDVKALADDAAFGPDK